MNWEEMTTLKSPCYGIIIFDNFNNDKRYHKCVIVKAPPKKNQDSENIGFPKGKSIKGENIFTGAAREVKEETGIDIKDLLFVDKICIHDVSNKGNISVSYLVAKFISQDKSNNHIFVYDNNELTFSDWVNYNDAITMLRKNRSNILRTAYEIITDTNITFTTGITLLDKYGTKLLQTQKSYNNVKNNDIKNNDVKISKSLSYILRHGVKELGLNMDSGARVLVSEILNLQNMKNVTIEQLKNIVDSNEKKRFELQTINDKLMIRAVQGHSKEMCDIIDENKLLHEITTPLSKCIHGTTKNAWNIIKIEGLKPLSRMYIHCATSEPDDENVISGMRTTSQVLIYINMMEAMNDGIKFYMSQNGVILTNGLNDILSPKYFKNIIFK